MDLTLEFVKHLWQKPSHELTLVELYLVLALDNRLDEEELEEYNLREQEINDDKVAYLQNKGVEIEEDSDLNLLLSEDADFVDMWGKQSDLEDKCHQRGQIMDALTLIVPKEMTDKIYYFVRDIESLFIWSNKINNDVLDGFCGQFA